ncbi:hypothetical protein J2S70_001555 [Trueperella bonasi]|uniref:Uncharacterized protein n=1 Tax=Trueperella bonasi TaxID=312286 RepID=A0ABT9NJI2_9ACTO|nr:hypothetical protein [Trueperella bonasi]
MNDEKENGEGEPRWVARTGASSEASKETRNARVTVVEKASLLSFYF